MTNPLRLQHSEPEWLEAFEGTGALWRHSGNPLDPHAELTSGRHSGIFFNGEKIKERPVMLDEVTHDLLSIINRYDYDLSRVDYVIGPAMGAVTVAHDLARQIEYTTGRTCRTGYSVWREEHDSEGVLIRKWMELPRTELPQGAVVIVVEDTCTSANTVQATVEAVEAAGGTVLPFTPVIVNRSGKEELHGRPIISLVSLEAVSWEPEDCPLCPQSAALRPKIDGNWERLTVRS